MGQRTLIINDDSITTALHQNYTLYNKDLKPLYKSIENDILVWGLSHGYTVIVDRPNMSSKTRARYIAIAKSLDEEQIICVKFKREFCFIHAKRRTESDSRGFNYDHWLAAAQRKEREYEEPKITEGFTDIFTNSPETVGIIQGYI